VATKSIEELVAEDAKARAAKAAQLMAAA